MRNTSNNKWFLISIGFLAIFIIITAIIITSKVSEYNSNKDIVTASHQLSDDFNLDKRDDIFI